MVNEYVPPSSLAVAIGRLGATSCGQQLLHWSVRRFTILSPANAILQCFIMLYYAQASHFGEIDFFFVDSYIRYIHIYTLLSVVTLFCFYTTLIIRAQLFAAANYYLHYRRKYTILLLLLKMHERVSIFRSTFFL